MTPRICVLTPVYRTPLPLFEAAFHSLLEQSCGFEQLEWVVAVHNMDDGYAAALRAITGERENVRFLRVEGGSTPSVPRNRCLDCANGEFVFFLDSDDEMSPECIEQTVSAMERCGADMAVYSCAIRSASGSMQLEKRVRLNAPDRELVVYRQGDPRILSLMTEWGGMLWARGYRRDFLRSAGIRFDERVALGEDYLFNLALSPLARCVCALPGLTGTFHRIRADGTAQTALFSDREGEPLLHIFKAAQSCGAAELLWHLVSAQVLRIGHVPDTAPSASIHTVLRQMRVMAPRMGWTRERIAGKLALCCAVLPIPDTPRLRQRHEVLETPLKAEELRSRAAAAAEENVELRTVGTEGRDNPFLGLARSEARPEVCTIDLRHMTPERQASHMDSFRRVELLRGFAEGEVRCRVSVFRLTALRCALSITWDDRFVAEAGIARLRDRLCGDMGRYAPRFSTVGEMLRQQALLDPDRPVFRWWDGGHLRGVKRRELMAQMDALAASLRALGLTECRVAIAAPNSYAWVLLCLTLLREGMTAVALDPALNPQELGRRLERTRAAAVFLADEAPAPPCAGVRVLRLGGLAELVERGKLLPPPKAPVSVPAEREALILFTSGTTGFGKATVSTQGNLIAAARSAGACMEWYERTPLCLPLWHMAMHQDLMCQLYLGSEILISSAQFDVMLRDFRAFRPQCMHLVPRLLEMLRLLLAGKDPQSATDLLGGSMKMIYCGTAPFPEETARSFERLGICVCNQYGCTETNGPIARSPYRKPRRKTAIVPYPGTELRLRENGEILVRTAQVFPGYLDDPAATAQVLDEEGWFHTGDLGSIDPEDGALTVTGRLKNLILFSNGENVSPEELEHLISAFPQVEECLVFGQTDETIAVRIYPRAGERGMEPDALRQLLWEQIAAMNAAHPPYMRVKRLYISPAPLERNHMGKLKRTPMP